MEEDEDTIHVYKDGYQIEYFGIREPETFLSWVMEVSPQHSTSSTSPFFLLPRTVS